MAGYGTHHIVLYCYILGNNKSQRHERDASDNGRLLDLEFWVVFFFN